MDETKEKAGSSKLTLVLVIVAVICGAAAFGYVVYRTMSHTGDEAVAQMTSEERLGLDRINQLHDGMKVAEVYEVLGNPNSELFSFATWEGFGGSMLSQLRVYFADGHPRKLRWLKLGYFVYEKDI